MQKSWTRELISQVRLHTVSTSFQVPVAAEIRVASFAKMPTNSGRSGLNFAEWEVLGAFYFIHQGHADVLKSQISVVAWTGEGWAKG